MNSELKYFRNRNFCNPESFANSEKCKTLIFQNILSQMTKVVIFYEFVFKQLKEKCKLAHGSFYLFIFMGKFGNINFHKSAQKRIFDSINFCKLAQNSQNS